MKPIVVIADDLTGAAEIAGIGLRFGLATRLVVNRDTAGESTVQLEVINADTRALPEADARRIVGELVSHLDADTIYFKKIDSVLRGHITAEIEAISDATGRFDRVLLLPQNPTRQRIIRVDGTYLVNGVPLAQTTFADDPDHPATTSNVVDRLTRAKWPTGLLVDTAASLEPGTINICAADTFETVEHWIGKRTAGTMLVGAADAFTAMLIAEGYTARTDRRELDLKGRRLFVCGSTATASRRNLRAFAAANHIDILAAEPARVLESSRRNPVTIVMSPEPGGMEMDPRDIEVALGACTGAVVRAGACDWIFAEGGATAGVICKALNWMSLEVESELMPGVVILKPNALLRLVIKPGSYAWPATVLRT